MKPIVIRGWWEANFLLLVDSSKKEAALEMIRGNNFSVDNFYHNCLEAFQNFHEEHPGCDSPGGNDQTEPAYKGLDGKHWV